MQNWNQRSYLNPAVHAIKRIGEEYQVARHFVTECLAKGWKVSVWDGEEYTLVRSTNLDQILDAMSTTDEDVLRVRDAAGENIGRAQFTYGNSASEVLGDYTYGNDAFEAVCNETLKWAEKFDG